MKRAAWVLLGAVAVLSGCAMHHHDHAGHIGERLYLQPLVTVKADIVSVSPEPLVLRRSEANDRLVWNLPRGLSFPKEGPGIRIEGLLLDAKGEPLRPVQDAHLTPGAKPDPRTQAHWKCTTVDPQRVECTVDRKQSRVGIYKYTIRVVAGGKELRPADPHIYHPE